MKPHILDANALYRFLSGGPGADLVARLLKEARHSNQNLSMSVVNWGEVFYTIMRAIGRDRAEQAMAAVDGLPLTIFAADQQLTRRAADLRASYGLPYADCFAAALADQNSIVVTSTVKHFKLVPWIKVRALTDGKN